jgi:hypothetical protein
MTAGLLWALLAATFSLFQLDGDGLEIGGRASSGAASAAAPAPLSGLAGEADLSSAAATTQPGSAAASGELRRGDRAGIERDYARLPLAFEPNRGQGDSRAEFVSRGEGYSLALAPDSAMLAVTRDDQGLALGMRLVGANSVAEATPLRRLPGEVNHLVGERADWQTKTPTFERIAYRSVWPGTDVLWYGNRSRLEYDFRLAPGADPDRIALRFSGQDEIRVAANGDLVLESAAGAVRQRAPVAYQQNDGDRVPVESAYVVRGDRTVALRLGAYDHSRPLVIDPLLITYSTFLGGSGNEFGGSAIAVDGSGAAYVTGSTTDAAIDFPTTAGAFDTTHNGNDDVFVTKLNPAGSALSYSTFIGGAGTDFGYGIAVDGSGAAYLTGDTTDAATDYPTTAGAFDTTHNGGFDAFLTKLKPGGSGLEYSTFIGGSGPDHGFAIAVDGSGAAYLTGQTADAATDYPATSGSFDQTPNGVDDAFATKVNAAGGALSYSTFLGGSGNDDGFGIAVDASGAAYVTGGTADAGTDYPTTAGAFDQTHNGADDAFATKLNAAGSALSYSTLAGGSGIDRGVGIAVGGSGRAYLTGHTADAATDFPTTAGAFDRTQNGFDDAFATKLNAAGSALAYSTLLGGSSNDHGAAIALDGAGGAYLTGDTTDAATDYPTTPGAFDTTHNGSQDAFATQLSPTGDALVFSTFLGGGNVEAGQGIAVDGSGAAYLTGLAFDNDYPTTAGAFDTTHNGSRDKFVTKLSPPALRVLNAGVVEGDAVEQSAIVEVRLGQRHEQTITVDYATENGSAQAPGDYTSTAGTLTFHPGDTEELIEVPIADDALDERVETLKVRLSNARYAPIADSVGVVTITDDDDPPALTVNNKTITEGNAGTTNMVFTLALDGPSGKTVKASYETDDRTATAPSDYLEKFDTVTFNPGVTTRTVPIAIVGDLTPEQTETFRLLLTGAQNAELLDTSGRGEILDND